MSYFASKAEQVGPPARAFAAGYQAVSSGPSVAPGLLDPIDPTTIPATNPSYPAGTGLDVANLRYTFRDLGPQVTNTDAKSTRAILDLDGKFAGFDVDFSAGFTEVKLFLDGHNYVNPLNLQAALDSTTAPFLVGQPNSAAVDSFVSPLLHTVDTSKLSFGHFGLTRPLFALPAGDLAIAFGADYFQRSQYAVAPPSVAAGYYATSFSNNFTVGLRQVASGYFELAAPIIKQFEIDAAVRYDHYNLSGGKASPKVSFKVTPITPITQIALRGTASKGFRAGTCREQQVGTDILCGHLRGSDPVSES